MQKNNRFALGTAQIGVPYGIANQSGQIDLGDAAKILEYAWLAGLDTVDTAISYGDSEKRLGDIGVGQWQIISKLPSRPANCKNAYTWVKESVRDSLVRLKVSKLSGLLLHHSQQLLDPEGESIYRAMTELKDVGLLEKIAISIYSPKELDVLWPNFKFDLVQTPFNIIDRRIATSGWLSKLYESGTEVHARSIFLQGLLLMNNLQRPAYFNQWQSLWKHWDSWLDGNSMSPLQACVEFAMSQREISRIVIGIDSLKQLQQVLDSVKESNSLALPPITLTNDDLDLINPSHWNRS